MPLSVSSHWSGTGIVGYHVNFRGHPRHGPQFFDPRASCLYINPRADPTSLLRAAVELALLPVRVTREVGSHGYLIPWALTIGGTPYRPYASLGKTATKEECGREQRLSTGADTLGVSAQLAPLRLDHRQGADALFWRSEGHGAPQLERCVASTRVPNPASLSLPTSMLAIPQPLSSLQVVRLSIAHQNAFSSNHDFHYSWSMHVSQHGICSVWRFHVRRESSTPPLLPLRAKYLLLPRLVASLSLGNDTRAAGAVQSPSRRTICRSSARPATALRIRMRHPLLMIIFT